MTSERRARAVGSFAILVALSSCAKEVPPTPTSTVASVASPEASASALGPAPREPASSSASASASSSVTASDLDAYRGTIGASPVLVRLRRTPVDVIGARIDEKTGATVTLSGTSDGPELRLTEYGDDGRQTGSFVAHLDATGRLAGTSKDDKTGPTRAFLLAPIPRTGGRAIVVQRRRRSGKHARGDIAFPELYGLADARVEAEINALLASATSMNVSEGGLTVIEETFAVHLNRDDLFSVTLSEHYDVRPAQGGLAISLRLDTGATIALDDLFVDGGRARLAAMLKPLVAERIARTPGADARDAEMLETAYLLGHFTLEDAGLRLIAFYQLPRSYQRLDPVPGSVIPWPRLAPFLSPASPAAAAWRGRTGR